MAGKPEQFMDSPRRQADIPAGVSAVALPASSARVAGVKPGQQEHFAAAAPRQLTTRMPRARMPRHLTPAATLL